MPIQARVPVSHKGIKRLSSSNELDAQNVKPHQTTIKRQKTTPESHEPACCMSQNVLYCSCKGCCKNGGLWKFEMTSLNRDAFHRFHKGPQEQRDTQKMVQNRKADCFALLRWITKLKCVNSAVRTVITHPEKGCLKWLHGTMSEPPWKSH